MDLPVPEVPSGFTCGFAQCARSGITPGPSLRFDKPSQGFCSDNSLVVLFVELAFYNTVVLADWAEKDRNALLCQLNSYPDQKEGAA